MAPKGGNAKKESGRAKKAENEAKKQQDAAAEKVRIQAVAAVRPSSCVHPPDLTLTKHFLRNTQERKEAAKLEEGGRKTHVNVEARRGSSVEKEGSDAV